MQRSRGQIFTVWRISGGRNLLGLRACCLPAIWAMSLSAIRKGTGTSYRTIFCRGRKAPAKINEAGATKKASRGPPSYCCLKRMLFYDSLFRLQDLAATIHAGFQIDMVGTAKFAGILVFHVGGLGEGIGGTAHAAARGRCFTSGNCHFKLRSMSEGRETHPDQGAKTPVG